MTTLEVPGERQVVDAPPARSPWLLALRSLLRRKIAMAAIAYILLFYTVALLAPLLAPYSYTAQNLRNSYAPPSRQHPFGTDVNGRDVLSRVILATRTTMIVTIAASITGGFVIPVVLGLLAGYRGGWLDSLINRVGEALAGLPPLLMLFLLVGTFRPRFDDFIGRFYHVPAIGDALKAGGADLALLFTVLSLVGWVGGERVVRAQVLAVRQTEYVQAARAMGASTWRILRRHVYPNISWLVVVSISSSLGGIALSEIPGAWRAPAYAEPRSDDLRGQRTSTGRGTPESTPDSRGYRRPAISLLQSAGRRTQRCPQPAHPLTFRRSPRDRLPRDAEARSP